CRIRGADSYQNDGSRCCSRGRRRGGQLATAWQRFPPGVRRSQRERRLLVAADAAGAAATTTAEAGEPEADRQLGRPAQPHRAGWPTGCSRRRTRKLKRSWPSRESCRPSTPVAQVAAPTSQNSKRNNGTATAAAAAATFDENKVETLIEDEAQSKEAGQSQQLEENIQEEQDEEEEDPDIGVESFVSGDISRPCPESEAVQLALGQCWCFCTACWPEGRKAGQPGSSLWPVYFDWLAEDWSGATGCTKPKHSRRYAYEIYSTFLHEESPLSLLASNSDADASRQQLHDEAVHPLERLFGIGASTGADPASTVRQAQPLINRAQALMAPTLARLATGALADLQQKRRDGFLSDLLPALPGGSTPEQRRLFAARCRPGLLARLRMLRQSESAPAAAEASCLATLLVRGLDPELAESLAPGESPMLFGCQHRSVGRQKSLLSRMGRAAASAASASSGSGAAPDERLRVGAHALEPCALTKAQVCAACDQVLCGAAPQGLQCTADCEQVVHRSCAQQLSSAPCTKRAAARAKDASIGSVKASKSFGGSSNRRRLRHQRHPSSQASTPPAMPRQRFAGGRIDEVEDWMLSGRQVQRNIPDCADDLPILKLTSSRSDQAVSQLAAETFRAARIAPSLHHRANSIADS
uniref:Phorbol-ester/DAG-type domain-containing protein n=1 Tax=Macrostomum lignano TaxID=282301 RepID=A0A1I8F8C8_9PLAT